MGWANRPIEGAPASRLLFMSIRGPSCSINFGFICTAEGGEGVRVGSLSEIAITLRSSIVGSERSLAHAYFVYLRVKNRS
jgi:hypothetical protein